MTERGMQQNQIAERAGQESELHGKLAEWLAGEFARPEHETCVKLSMAPYGEGRREETLLSWDRTTEPAMFEQSRVLDLAMLIINTSEEFVDMLGTAAPRDGIRFVLRTVQALNGRKQKLFVVRPVRTHAASALGGASDVDPTLQGVLALQMQQNKVLFENQNQLVTGTTGVLLQQITRLQSDNAKLESVIERQSAQIVELQTSDDARMMEAISREKADARKDQMVGKIMALAPVVAAKLMGKEGAAGAPTPIALMVNELAGSIQQEQLYKIMMLLTMEQRILFGNIVQMASASGGGPAKQVTSGANGATTPPTTEGAASA
jgi:hypothetical protein